MRFLLFVCCIALAADPARSMVLDETPETPSGQSQAQRLRDSKAAPNSVLGDYGAELGRGLAESLDSSRTRDRRCHSGDVCFDVIRVERDYTEILCKKGSDYNIGQKKKICGSGEKWGGCGMTDAFAHHHTMTKAGNMQCD